jgi:hypothetical protein
MRTRTATLGASLLAALALAAGGSLVGPAAQADAYYLSSTAWSKWKHGDTHLNDLRFPRPRNPKFMPCITRSVTLTYGYWDHNAYFVSERRRNDPDINREENPVLVPRRGTYKWKACRWFGPQSAQYFVESTLSRGKVVVDKSLQELSGNHRHDDNRQGNYEWGGRIAFDSAAGVTEPSGGD